MDRFVGKAPAGDIVRCTNIPGSLKAREWDDLRNWMEAEAPRAPAWLCECIPPISILKCTGNYIIL